MLKYLIFSLAIFGARVPALPTNQAANYNLVQDILSSYSSPPKKPTIIDEYLQVDGKRDGGLGTPPPPTRPTPMPVNPGPCSASAVNCREFVYQTASTQSLCAALKQSDFVGGPSVNKNPGYCRWDFSVNACFCPRAKELCDNTKQCYWNKDPSLTGNPLAFLGVQ